MLNKTLIIVTSVLHFTIIALLEMPPFIYAMTKHMLKINKYPWQADDSEINAAFDEMDKLDI